MKKLFAIIALSAFALTAQAAPLNNIFTANPATTLVNVEHAAIVEKIGTSVNVTTTGFSYDGAGLVTGFARSVTSYADFNGTMWANFKAQAAANGFYATSAAQTRYLSAKQALSITCPGSALTQFAYPFGTENTAPEPCTTYQAIKAVSN